MPIKALVVGLGLLRKECCDASAIGVVGVVGVTDATRDADTASVVVVSARAVWKARVVWARHRSRR